MKIETLQYEEMRTGWTLEETRFKGFSLLVGPSGAGKTKILRCLERIGQVAMNGSPTEEPLDSERWTVRFSHEGQRYTWELHAAALDGLWESDSLTGGANRPATPRSQITFERLTSEEHGVLFERDAERLLFRHQEAPMLTPAESVVVLLTDPLVIPVQLAFRRLVFLRATLSGATSSTTQVMSGAFIGSKRGLAERLAQVRASYSTVEDLLGAAGLPVHLKAFRLREMAPERFEEISSRFCEMFSSVEELQIGLLSESTLAHRHPSAEGILFSIRERGVTRSIPETEFSSGMQWALLHLLKVSLAPPASVFVIDEFENSLGLNCMPSLTDFLLEHAPQHQFILTSHHPYIINQIPIDRWAMVQRRAGRVRVVPAREIPALQGASHLDAFTRLLNLPEDAPGAV